MIRGNHYESSRVTRNRQVFAIALSVGALWVAAAPALAAPIKAAVLRSTGTAFLGQTIWRELNAGWDHFGKTPVTIDYTSLASSNWTIDAFHATAADVIVLSNPAFLTYSPADIAVLSAYVQEGHGLIISYGKFRSADIALAPLVGLDESTRADTNTWSAGFNFNLLAPNHPLFRGMDEPYSPGDIALASPLPYRSEWTLTTGVAVAEARFQTASGFYGNGIIVANEGPGYRGAYFSHYPENKADGANLQDMQLFYNAIVWTGSVPEPSTLMLALMGASVLAKRKRNNR